MSNIDPLIKEALAEMTPLIRRSDQTGEQGSRAPARGAYRPERILQVLRNLLGNAVKFTPRDQVASVTPNR
jgi:signal transduction histidine kinase